MTFPDSQKRSFAGEVGGGYRFTPNIAGELSYQYLGQYSKVASVQRVGLSAESIHHDIKMHALRLGVLGIYPVNSRFEVFGSLSAHFIHYASTRLADGRFMAAWMKGETRKSTKTVKVRPGIGIGVTYKITENLHLRAQYEFIATIMTVPFHRQHSMMGMDNVHLAKVGLVYQF